MFRWWKWIDEDDTGVCRFQQSPNRIEIGLESLNHDTSESVNYLKMASRNALVTIELDVGKNSFFSSSLTKVPSNVSLINVKLEFTEGGAAVCLQE